MHRLGAAIASRAQLVLLISLGVLAITAVFGVTVFSRLLNGGFDDPSAQAIQARNLLRSAQASGPDLIVLVRARSGTVDDPRVVASGTALTRKLEADDRVTGVTSYWQTHAPGLRSKDSTAALVLAHVTGDDEQAGQRGVDLADAYNDDGDAAIQVQVGGPRGTDVGSQVGKDLGLAEGIAVPITLLLLLLAFGSAVAAVLPLSVTVFAVFGAFAALRVITAFADVSVFALNLTTALGLGLGIDYALLMVSRFREELGAGKEVPDAVARSVATAGRTIAFSALTVAVALSTLAVFPVYFLKSFAYAGVATTVFAALAALFVLPAALALIGRRVDAGKVFGKRFVPKAEAPFWARLARGVMRRPVLATLAVLVPLLVLAAPLLGVTFGTPDDRVLPTSAASHQVGDALREQFATNPARVDVLVTGDATAHDVAAFAQRVSTDGAVDRVDGKGLAFAHGRPATLDRQSGPLVDTAAFRQLAVTTSLDPASDDAQDLVHRLRALAPPSGAHLLVGGNTAQLVDSKHAIASRLLLAAVIIVVTTFILLFLFTGSIVQPLRALVSNAITLGATLGAMVWIFQDGHLSGVLGFTASPTNTAMPVLLFCIAFGLSMDYEVFLISRIKELHDQGRPNEEAVAQGLARTGRIVSTAAALLAVSFFAFGTSRVSFIQFFGLGTGLAILIDATLIRGVLVPAFMRLTGEAAWYAPAALRRLHARAGVAET